MAHRTGPTRDMSPNPRRSGSAPAPPGFTEGTTPAYETARPLEAMLEREYANAVKGTGAHVAVLDELAAHGFTQEELFELVVPRRTLARRKEAGQRLSTEETDRAVRLARITAHAERVFGDPEKAHRWLRKPSRTLQGITPLSLLRSETSAQLVEETLYRIEFGMLA